MILQVPKDDETKREFKSRFVLSCYMQYVEVKAAKEMPKKAPEK